MTISMIAAMAKGRVIGKDNKMPWHLPADLKHFKSVTMGKPIIMGRKTYQSIGKALPGRDNIVISNDRSFTVDDAIVVDSIKAAVQSADENSNEIMIIGGGRVYESLLPRATKLYLTFIDLEIDGDTFFPDYEKDAKWNTVALERYDADEKNAYDYQFVTLE
ncbi:MAG: type 3 dihydrofolate reductase, partial [Pseudomonadota bacterium]